MRNFTIVVLLVITIFAKAQTVKDLRQQLSVSMNSLAETIKLKNLSETTFTKTGKPVFQAFTATAQFLMAKNDPNVFRKLGYFKKGKNLMDDAVKKAPADVEIRWLRYNAQQNTPAMLCYKSSMPEDKAVIKKYYRSSGDQELILIISKNFNW